MNVIRSGRPILGVRYGIHWAHGKQGSSVVLKTEANWKTISGIVINTKWGALWLYFRNGRF